MFAVGTDDLHVLARLGQMLPLGGALLPPAAEVAFESALALTAILVILAVPRFYLAVPPLVIVAVALIRHTAAASAITPASPAAALGKLAPRISTRGSALTVLFLALATGPHALVIALYVPADRAGVIRQGACGEIGGQTW